MSVEYKKKLGVIFIVNFPFDLFEEEEDVANVQRNVTDFMNGYFHFDEWKVNDNSEIYFISCFSGLAKNRFSPNTLIHRLQEDNGKYFKEPVLNFGAVNLGNKDVLSGVLVSVKKMIDAKEYVLFFYNHSSAFGSFNATPEDFSGVSGRSVFNAADPSENGFLDIFQNDDPMNLIGNIVDKNSTDVKIKLPQFFSDSFTVINQRKKYPLKRILREEISEDYKPDMLTNSELLIALDRAFTLNSEKEENTAKNGTEMPDDPQVKVIFGAGCYFLNIELIYTLREFAEYFVGAQGVMPAPSFHYPTIINSLHEQLQLKESIDYEQVITNSLSAIEQVYTFKPDDGHLTEKEILSNEILQSWIDATYVSAIRCRSKERTNNIARLAILFDELILSFFNKPKESIFMIFETIFDQHDLSQVYNSNDGPFHLYDLKNFVATLKKIDGEKNTKVQAVYTDILHTLDDIRVGQPFVHSKAQNRSAILEIFNGLSFYFPVDRDAALKSFYFLTFYGSGARNESFFSKETLWNSYINFFHKYVKLFLQKRVKESETS